MSELIRSGHLFSQHSLNTYRRCARRFLLKYVEERPWPTPEEEDPPPEQPAKLASPAVPATFSADRRVSCRLLIVLFFF